MTNRGGPQRPLSDDEIARKFRDNVEPVLHADAVDEFLALADGLETATSVSPLLAATAASPHLMERTPR